MLNTRTLHVSPQFHVTFDDKFMTVPFLRSGDVPPDWFDLVLNSTESATDEAFDSSNTWMNVENNHPFGGLSNEEAFSASPVENIVSTSSTPPSCRRKVPQHHNSVLLQISIIKYVWEMITKIHPQRISIIINQFMAS